MKENKNEKPKKPWYKRLFKIVCIGAGIYFGFGVLLVIIVLIFMPKDYETSEKPAKEVVETVEERVEKEPEKEVPDTPVEDTNLSEPETTFETEEQAEIEADGFAAMDYYIDDSNRLKDEEIEAMYTTLMSQNEIPVNELAGHYTCSTTMTSVPYMDINIYFSPEDEYVGDASFLYGADEFTVPIFKAGNNYYASGSSLTPGLNLCFSSPVEDVYYIEVYVNGNYMKTYMMKEKFES